MDLMEKKLVKTGPDRVEPLTVKPGTVLYRVEPLSVIPGKLLLAPVQTLFPRGQTLWRLIQQCLREAFLEVFGDLTENSAFAAPGPIQPSERQIRTHGLTSTLADRYIS